MASLLCQLCTCFVILVTMNGFIEASREFKVGDEFGWQVPDANNGTIYSQWATRNRFLVGDSLSFEYKNDSVLEVDKWGYYHCSTSKPITESDNGKSIIKLDRPGPYYFISGASDHCKNGQRLIVEVMGLHPHSPPSIAMSPESYQLAPSPLSSSGVSVSVTVSSVFMALIIATFVSLLV